MKLMDLLDRLSFKYSEYITVKDIEYLQILFENDKINNTVVVEPEIKMNAETLKDTLHIHVETEFGEIFLNFRPETKTQTGFPKFNIFVNNYKNAQNAKWIDISLSKNDELNGFVNVENESGRWSMHMGTIAGRHYNTLHYASPEVIAQAKRKHGADWRGEYHDDNGIESSSLVCITPEEQIATFREYYYSPNELFEKHRQIRK